MNNNFVKYKDLLTIKDFDEETNKEKFVYLPLEDSLIIGRYQLEKNMIEYGEKIPVRETVYKKLIKVAERLKKYNENYKLIVVYGFRDMKIQESYFAEIYNKVKNDFKDAMEMYEYIHEKIAVPEVSGHPTGGAVDIAIYDEKKAKIIDFGTEILDWNTAKCYYCSKEISDIAINNRKLLRKLMLEEEFAPYDGEWWHFSYGDKEWAFYYKKEKALYNQVRAEDVFLKYIKYIPSGNNTALVLKKDFTSKQIREINEYILKQNKNIEQVGFLENRDNPELQMAGGEFCGNATRSAAHFYLDGKPGNIKIRVNGKNYINAGVYQDGNAWCEIPLYYGNDMIIEKEFGIYQVIMDGIISIVIQEQVAKQYLINKSELKDIAVKFIEKYNLGNNKAVGVIFVEKNEKLKIHPVVWVRDVNTLYYETACGSGSTAVAMVEAYLTGENKYLEIVQPSGLSIISEITVKDKNIIKAVISGKVKRKKDISYLTY